MTSSALNSVDARTSNLHCHTQFCDGRDTMEAFVESAIGHGLTALGFSPHSPVPIESPCNMSKDAVHEYIAEISRLKSIYGDRIRLLTGMEIDYLDEEWGPSNPYFDSLPLDYRIGSVHFIPDFDGRPVDIDGRFSSFRRKMSEHFRNDIRYVVDKFFSQSMKMIEAGHFDILGHADKIARNASLFSPGIEDELWFSRQVRALIETASDRDIAIEINTKVLDDTGRIFPAQRHLGTLIQAGARLFVNSDSHTAPNIISGRNQAILHISDYCQCHSLSTRHYLQHIS